MSCSRRSPELSSALRLFASPPSFPVSSGSVRRLLPGILAPKQETQAAPSRQFVNSQRPPQESTADAKWTRRRTGRCSRLGWPAAWEKPTSGGIAAPEKNGSFSVRTEESSIFAKFKDDIDKNGKEEEEWQKSPEFWRFKGRRGRELKRKRGDLKDWAADHENFSRFARMSKLIG